MILAFDTATATASIALYDLETDQLLAEYTWQARRRHTQDLLTTARAMLEQMTLTVDQVIALAVTTGPGSFTGVRIGISAVKGIGMGMPHPPRVVGVPTLCVTAAPWLSLARRAENGPVIVCAYIQAGRGRFNWLLFAHEPLDVSGCNGSVQVGLTARPSAADHRAGTTEEFMAALDDLNPYTVWLVGESTSALEAVVESRTHVCMIDAVSGVRRAGHLARLAKCFMTKAMDESLATLQPLYLRAP